MEKEMKLAPLYLYPNNDPNVRYVMPESESESELHSWFRSNLGEYAADIATNGADGGYRKLIYTPDILELFEEFKDEIWDVLTQYAEKAGKKNVFDLLSDSNKSINSFEDILIQCVYLAIEIIASEFDDDDDDRFN